MNIALIGYGKMGKEVERYARERGWNITAIVDLDTPSVTQKQKDDTEVVIHYASAKTVIDDLTPWADAKKAIVLGTTGWEKERERVESLVTQHQIGLIYASNFSIGVNIFLQLIKDTSAMLEKFPEYDAFIHETHHKNKLDSPSGTALTMGQIVLQHLHRKKELLVETSHTQIRPEQLHISSSRSGSVVGTHTLTFDSLADSIELRHTAKDRSGFALGTLLAAEWIRNKHGLYTMTDIFQDLFTTGDR